MRQVLEDMKNGLEFNYAVSGIAPNGEPEPDVEIVSSADAYREEGVVQ